MSNFNCVEYQYRNLPSNSGLWYVSGKDRVHRSGGILEWCESEKDALITMAKMYRDPRFTDLSIGKQQ